MRLLSTALVSILTWLPPSLGLLTNIVLGLLMRDDSGYCCTALLSAPLTQIRMQTVATMLNHVSLPLLVLLPAGNYNAGWADGASSAALGERVGWEPACLPACTRALVGVFEAGAIACNRLRILFGCRVSVNSLAPGPRCRCRAAAAAVLRAAYLPVARAWRAGAAAAHTALGAPSAGSGGC